MDQSADFTRSIGSPDPGRSALLIDGENVASIHAASILGDSFAAYAIRRVYGDVAKLNGWAKVPELRVVHAQEGRNSADILLTIDAMTFCQNGVRNFVIVTADGGLVHLVRQLRELACRIVVIADDRATVALRAAGHSFVELGVAAHSPKQPPAAKPATLDSHDFACMIHAFVDASSTEGVTVAALNRFARKVFPSDAEAKRNIPEWLQWLGDRPTLFTVDPPGHGARIRTTGRASIALAAPTP